ncbi:MAG: hypothetical protein KME46_35220 [Brasilonema angustatum HA4187-MV1]|jgi:hypothetical protein|nr:hypothetical protein [Brasilonema angustatum HA4187-MV1]
MSKNNREDKFMNCFKKFMLVSSVFSMCIFYSGKTSASDLSDLTEIGKLIQENWVAIVSNFWSPNFKQVYMEELSPQETNDVRNQYRDRADGVLNDRCIDKIIKTYNFDNVSATASKTTNRFLFASRVEDGKTNCYLRMPNEYADKITKIRGY